MVRLLLLRPVSEAMGGKHTEEARDAERGTVRARHSRPVGTVWKMVYPGPDSRWASRRAFKDKRMQRMLHASPVLKLSLRDSFWRGLGNFRPQETHCTWLTEPRNDQNPQPVGFTGVQTGT